MNPVEATSEHPSYKIEQNNNTVKIIVTPGKSPQTQKTMIEEAKKSSLMAMAYIRYLANEKHPTAENIAAFYDDYRNFLINSDEAPLLQRSKSILSDSSDEFSKDIALYLSEVLARSKITQGDAQIFMENLIPSIKETLQMPSLKKICPEQIVKVPEMQASHNAFPDLIKYQGAYYATFREAKTHVEYKDYGKIRILRGNYLPDTCQWEWQNIALLEKEPYDLRDPKFFIDSNNNLRLIIDASVIDKEDATKQLIPYTAYLNNNLEWVLEKANVDPSADGAKGQWLWRVTWNDQKKAGYGFSYKESDTLSLMKTTDGIKYEKIATVSTDKLTKNEQLSESTIRFQPDGTAIALIRTERHGLIGISKDSDYTKWSFEVIPFRIGGPNFVVSERDEKIWAAARYLFLNKDNTLDDATIVASMNEKEFVPRLRLKSGFDSSYPGLVLEEDGSLTVLYYSSEADGKSHIYITRVALP